MTEYCLPPEQSVDFNRCNRSNCSLVKSVWEEAGFCLQMELGLGFYIIN